MRNKCCKVTQNALYYNHREQHNGQPKGRKEIEMKNFNELPENIQAEVKAYLTEFAFGKIDVFFENGDYNYGACIKAHHAEDRERIGTYKMVNGNIEIA